MYNGGESSGFPSIRSGEGELAATLSYRTTPIVFPTTATTPILFCILLLFLYCYYSHCILYFC